MDVNVPVSVNIVILNYNGLDLIKKYLPSAVEAAKRSIHKVDVTVLDNGSGDGSVEYVKNNFPSVMTAVAPENKLLVSYNDYLAATRHELVFLTNNDIRFSPDCIDPLVGHFSDDEVFFVAPKVLTKDGKGMDGGCMDYNFQCGLYKNRFKAGEGCKYTLFIGSSGMFDRKKFMQLGGYDDLYLPGTYEDIDVCYRGWKHGWYGMYEEKSVVFHEASASFKNAYSYKKRQTIAARNAYFFVWKNVRSAGLMTGNIIFFPVLLLFNAIRLRFDLCSGGLLALMGLGKVLARRAAVSGEIVRTDREIMEIISEKKEGKD